MTRRPLPAASAGLEVVDKSTKRQALAFLAGLVGVLGVAGSAVADPATVAGKQAQADRVLAEIREIDSSVARAAEAYNLANIELARIRGEQQRNARMLVLARKNLGVSQQVIQRRLIALYTGGDTGSTLEIVLGATSLEEVVTRLETIDRVSSQDARVLRQVIAFRAQVQARKGQLRRARARQADVVAARAAHKAEVERQLADRQQLLTSIKSEISRIRARQRARALALAQQARERLATQPPADAEATALAAAALAGEVEELTGAPPSRYGGVVGIAMRFLGTPYMWGGSSPSGFDCSGFVMYVYSQVGVSLPHNAAAQYGYGTPVSRAELQPGDLVFFDGLGHNGIYVGGGAFIHSPHTGDVVKISSLSDSWYASKYVGARRL